MTQIDSVRISDFKGIGEIELPCKQLNIITGRNNTGKTSILEAVDLLFNPNHITDYEENLRYLVNSQKKAASISSSYKLRQTSISDFAQDADGRSQKEMGIRIPRDEEVLNNFINSVYEILELNEKYPVPAPDHIFEPLETDMDSKEFNQLLQEHLRETVSSISPKRVLNSGIKENMIILEREGEEYPVVYFGENYERIRTELEEQAANSIIGEFDQDEELLRENIKDERMFSAIHRLLAPRFGSLRTIGKPPNDIHGVQFLDDISGDRESFDLEQERAAVKTRKIQQYLITNDIIPGLIDFSFDKVIFQDTSNSEAYEVPYDFLGDGVKVLVRILWELFDNNREGQVLMLEEPENHMHPGYIERLVTQLIDISINRNVQLFITTHNLDLIDAFYSPQIEGERENFLKQSFELTQLTDSVPKSMGYSRFRKKRDELNLDPRGV